MHLPAHLPPLFVLTDPARTPDPIGLANALPRGCGVIYRHFGQPDREQIARALKTVANTRHLTLLIGSDPKLAMKIGADGVHWSEARRGEARRWRSRFAIMTCAAHSRDGLRRAHQAGCDAMLLSTVFASASASASAPMGAIRFRHLVRRISGPQLGPGIYALGGVSADNFGQISHVAGGAAIGGASVFKQA